MNISKQRVSSISTVTGVLSWLIVFVAEVQLRKKDGILVSPNIDDLTERELELSSESSVGPVSMTNVTDDTVILALLIAGTIFASCAIVAGIRAYLLGSRSHYAAAGLVLGLIALVWQAKLILSGV